MANKEKAPSKELTNSSPYAIVEASGTQFWLEPNRYYDLNRINASEDETVVFDKVLLINDGKTTKIGTPFIKDAAVQAKVLAHRRGPKIIVYKMRPKKKTRRKNGHRQELTRIIVESINSDKETKAKKTTKSSKVEKEKSEE